MSGNNVFRHVGLSSRVMSFASSGLDINTMLHITNETREVAQSYGKEAFDNLINQKQIDEDSEKGDITLALKVFQLRRRSGIRWGRVVGNLIKGNHISELNDLFTVGLFIDTLVDCDTALLSACSKGNVRLFNMVMTHHPFVDYTIFRSNASPLTEAIRQGNFYIVRKLVEAGASVKFSLRLAVEKGDLTMVDYLLNNGADPNEVYHGDVCLDRVIIDNNKPMIDLLLYHGADINGGDTGVNCITGENPEMIKEFIEKGLEVNPNELLLTVVDEKLCPPTRADECIRVLVEIGADLDKYDSTGKRPLAYAIMRGGMVGALLKHGANIDNITVSRYDAFGFAILYDQHDANNSSFKTLIDHGLAKPPGELLNMCVKKSYTAGIEILHKAGYNLDEPYKGKSAVYVAITNYEEDCLETLLRCGANPNFSGEDNEYPLLEALRIASEDVDPQCRHLIEYGAEVKLGLVGSPLQVAAERGWPIMARIFLEGGADISTLSKMSLDLAHGHKSIREIFSEYNSPITQS